MEDDPVVEAFAYQFFDAGNVAGLVYIAAYAPEAGEALGAINTRYPDVPLSAASIAQVHRAELRDGRVVAVKVLRPGVEQRFKGDLAAFSAVARMAEDWSVDARRLRLIEVVQTLARTVTIEMDLRLEAAAIAEMRDNVKGDADSGCQQSTGSAPRGPC